MDSHNCLFRVGSGLKRRLASRSALADFQPAETNFTSGASSAEAAGQISNHLGLLKAVTDHVCLCAHSPTSIVIRGAGQLI